jgi:hypothetical protein
MPPERLIPLKTPAAFLFWVAVAAVPVQGQTGATIDFQASSGGRIAVHVIGATSAGAIAGVPPAGKLSFEIRAVK